VRMHASMARLVHPLLAPEVTDSLEATWTAASTF
jgi:hypothetical protein